jgi:predicted Ser/Thr protein kinase
MLRRFHDAGLDHADLNAHNILLDSRGDFWLIDFDKARLRAAGGWREGNLQRLERSLRKLQGLSPRFCWTQADWAELRAGYGSPVPG